MVQRLETPKGDVYLFKGTRDTISKKRIYRKEFQDKIDNILIKDLSISQESKLELQLLSWCMFSLFAIWRRKSKVEIYFTSDSLGRKKPECQIMDNKYLLKIIEEYL